MVGFKRAIAKDEALILRMDAVCFPLDAPPVFAGAHWWIGWDGETPAAHCAWKIAEHDAQQNGQKSLAREDQHRNANHD